MPSPRARAELREDDCALIETESGDVVAESDEYGCYNGGDIFASSVTSDLMAPACSRRPREDLLLEGAKIDFWLRSQGEQSCMPSTARRALFECITNTNQSWMTDSNHSLDMGSLARESRLMVKQPYQLYIERIAPEKNMARFYALAVQPTLFGEVSLVRAWGRIGTRGQQMVHLFDSESQAVSLFLDVLREKRKRGYRPKPPVDIELI